MRPRHLLVAVALLALSMGGQPPVSTGSDAPVKKAAPKKPAALPGIVFAGAPIFDEKTDGGDGVYQGSHHWRDSYIYPRGATYHRRERTTGPIRRGRNLYSLIPARPDGKLTRLTHLKTGEVFKPEPSYDGKKVLFAMRRDGEDWFHLYEINVDGTGLKQLTDGPFNDFAGVYLPDGRIVFCSDRTGYLDEYHEERTETLFVMDGAGKNIRQITFGQGTYFEPSVLKDGRILFSFWDAFHIDVPPFDKHETFLMTVNPDGTEERHLFGAGQYRFFNRERHSGIGLTQAREMPDGRILVQSEMGPSLLDLRAGISVKEALAPVFPGTTSIQIGGTTHRAHLSPLGTRSTAYPLQDGRFLFSKTAPGARDSSICVCDPQTRDEQLVVNIPNYAEFDAVPILQERPKPAILPQRAKPEGTTTRFLAVAGTEADHADRASAMRKARYFRVIEAEYTGVTTSSHTNFETRILGVVPILADGSAYFEAPADTPIFLDPIDAAGNRVLMPWSYPQTSVAVGTYYPATQIAYMVGRAGETKSCYGCHATQTDAVPNKPILALKFEPVKITRESTDLQYRRNDPDNYRRQGRLGEAAKYRPWLTSKDADLRARACEMLMYVEDGVEDVPVIAKLLEDAAVEVRRAAALALTRLATKEEIPALTKAWKDRDADWQVRFAAGVALEALGEIPDGWDSEPFAQPTDLIVAHMSAAALKETYQDLVKKQLTFKIPPISGIRSAGKRKDAEAVPLLVPWLKQHDQEYHAAESAVALGRIGTKEAVAALWEALRREVPNKKVHISRYLQHGPRPEEYALLRGLYLADAKTEMKDVHLLIALLPNTFMEKPRFEDRFRSESQRVLVPRLLLEKAGLRQDAVRILLAALRGEQLTKEPLYDELLKGMNLERPFSEHGRPFPVVKQINAEEALWLLTCFLEPQADLGKLIARKELEALAMPLLRAQNHRERIDAAVLVGIVGFGADAAKTLADEIAKPYDFGEISSIGKGMPDENFRDKAYFVQALAQHVGDVDSLKRFADPKKMTRDIRYGLTQGLAKRGKADGIPLLLDMATRDPITLVRQQARYALHDIQDAHRLAEKPVPEVKLPKDEPLEALYPPRGLEWKDTGFEEFDRHIKVKTDDLASLQESLKKCQDKANFRNLTIPMASGAQQMMIRYVEEARLTFAAFGKLRDTESLKQLHAILDTPYPYLHYLTLDALAERDDPTTVPVLLKKLEGFHQANNSVGFWWCCEALARLKAKDALPILAKVATADGKTGIFGPEGMHPGYIAAKALAQIAGDAKHADVARLLKGENIWLRAGALAGLAEAGAAGIDDLLRAADDEGQPAVVRTEARLQRQRSRKNSP